MNRPIGVAIDEKLSVDKFKVDEENPHIILASDPKTDEFDALIQCCPAGLYARDAEGEVSFDYAGCLECGTCRMVSTGAVLEKWEYPKNAQGISYRFG